MWAVARMRRIFLSLILMCGVMIFSSYGELWAQGYFVRPNKGDDSESSRSKTPRLFVTPDRMGKDSPVIVPRFKTQKKVMRTPKYQYKTQDSIDNRGLALIDKVLDIDPDLMTGKRQPTSFAEINQMQLAASVPQVTGALKLKREAEQTVINDLALLASDESGADAHFKSVAKKVGGLNTRKPIRFPSQDKDEEKEDNRPPRIFNVIE